MATGIGFSLLPTVGHHKTWPGLGLGGRVGGLLARTGWWDPEPPPEAGWGWTEPESVTLVGPNAQLARQHQSGLDNQFKVDQLYQSFGLVLVDSGVVMDPLSNLAFTTSGALITLVDSKPILHSRVATR